MALVSDITSGPLDSADVGPRRAAVLRPANRFWALGNRVGAARVGLGPDYLRRLRRFTAIASHVFHYGTTHKYHSMWHLRL